ncbi:MAG: hypothetical protein L0956_05960 [Candidatus Mariimomonas ferrooxydans]
MVEVVWRDVLYLLHRRFLYLYPEFPLSFNSFFCICSKSKRILSRIEN